MKTLYVIAIACVSLLALPAGAQTETTTPDLATQSPDENTAGGNVTLRAPGTWVRAALTRHQTLITQRLNGPRYGQPNSTEAQARFGNAGAGGTTATGDASGLGSLLDLANQFAGGNGLSGLGSLIAGMAGGGSSGTSTGGTATNATSGNSVPAPADGQNYTLQDLLAMAAANEGSGGSGSSTGRQRAFNVPEDDAKVDERAQQTNQTTPTGTETGTTPEPSFQKRWANAMLQSLFTALSNPLAQTLYVELFKDALRPLILPPAEDTSTGTGDTGGSGGTGDTGGSGGTGGTGGSGGTGNNGTTTPGGGLNDVPAGGSGNTGGSTL